MTIPTLVKTLNFEKGTLQRIIHQGHYQQCKFICGCCNIEQEFTKFIFENGEVVGVDDKFVKKVIVDKKTISENKNYDFEGFCSYGR